MSELQTATIVSNPVIQTPQEILAGWRALIEEERNSERSCLKHGLKDQSKWHEGKADAIERCADVLEYHIIRRFKFIRTEIIHTNPEP